MLRNKNVIPVWSATGLVSPPKSIGVPYKYPSRTTRFTEVTTEANPPDNPPMRRASVSNKSIAAQARTKLKAVRGDMGPAPYILGPIARTLEPKTLHYLY